MIKKMSISPIECSVVTGKPINLLSEYSSIAPKAGRKLAAYGVPWGAVIGEIKSTFTEKYFAHGLINTPNFGSTAKWRTYYVSDGTGHFMLYWRTHW